MTDRHLETRIARLAALLRWLLVCLFVTLAALATVVLRSPSYGALDRVHAAGTELGLQMCMGMRGELERPPVRRSGGGML